jgi:hypothetical protein
MPKTIGSDDRSHDEDHEHAAGREDQLTTAPKSTEADAKPRIELTETEPGLTRIDIRDDANARPGKPDATNPGTTKPGTTNSGTTKPDTSQPAEGDK